MYYYYFDDSGMCMAITEEEYEPEEGYTVVISDTLYSPFDVRLDNGVLMYAPIEEESDIIEGERLAPIISEMMEAIAMMSAQIEVLNEMNGIVSEEEASHE